MKIREAHIFSDTVVNILKEIRINKNISQYKIAKECNISKSAINYIERLERRPTLYTLIIISSALEVNLSDIIKQAEKINRELINKSKID